MADDSRFKVPNPEKQAAQDLIEHKLSKARILMRECEAIADNNELIFHITICDIKNTYSGTTERVVDTDKDEIVQFAQKGWQPLKGDPDEG